MSNPIQNDMIATGRTQRRAGVVLADKLANHLQGVIGIAGGAQIMAEKLAGGEDIARNLADIETIMVDVVALLNEVRKLDVCHQARPAQADDLT